MTEDLLSGERYLRAMFDAFPAPMLVVDRDLLIHDSNRAARGLMGEESDVTQRRLCGDMLRCIHARQADGGCGTTEQCPDCVLRQAAEAVADGGTSFRRTWELKIQEDGRVRSAWYLVSGDPFAYRALRLVVITLEDITELVELRRIIPVCSLCRKVRDDSNYWHEVEDYLRKHAGVQFSHGICPACMKEHYPDCADHEPEESGGDAS